MIIQTQPAMPLFGRLINAAQRCAVHNGTKCTSRYTSTYKKSNDNDDKSLPIKKSVFISQSTDIFANLALEDWLYRNYDFANHHILLLWKNNPCVVIGRHQNPWKECNVRAAEKRGIVLARRNSGGGTVYHDNGNLNLSFFTSRERYNRKQNLYMITKALLREWRLESLVNKREDIVVDSDYKVSGTAAKLGRPNAYHHCTLLVDVNKNDLSLALRREEEDIITNATASVRSSIKNLTDVNSNIKMDKLITAISREYLYMDNSILESEEHNLFQQQTEFQFISPSENQFPGLDKLINDFRSWSWNFGKTPKFTVNRVFDVMAYDGRMQRINLCLEVQNGIVEEISINLLNELALIDLDQDTCVFNNFYGTRYSHETVDSIMSAISCKTVTLKAKDESNAIVTR